LPSDPKQPPNIELEDFVRKSLPTKDELLKSGYFPKQKLAYDMAINDFSDIRPRILIVNYYGLNAVLDSFVQEISSHFRKLSKYWTKHKQRDE
jgi:hypothetical protein